MIDLAVVAGAGVGIVSVLLVFGCICHLFKKTHAQGFSTFENDPEAGHTQGFSIFSSQNETLNTEDTSKVTFEPLPDILAKTVSATALRPRISSTESERHRSSATCISVYRPFPRSNLLYVKEIGIGWFGQVLLGDAEKINISSKKTRVVVKLLKDDATGPEQQLFLEEVAAYRDIEHPNVIQLLGQCTESTPYLAILEHSPYGDLKTYLRKNVLDRDSITKRGTLVHFLIDMAAGLASLHKHGFLHHDFACRNCLVMSDLSIKVGDYGVAEDHFREDYYDTGQNLLPVRWMAPETLHVENQIWQVTQFTQEANIWSFGVALWEVLEFGQRPYDHMSDEDVLQKVIKYSAVNLISSTSDSKNSVTELIQRCCSVSQQRPSLQDIHHFLHQIRQKKLDQEAADETEFDLKWEQAVSKEAKIVPVGEKNEHEGENTTKVVEEKENIPLMLSPIKTSAASVVSVTVDVHAPPAQDLTEPVEYQKDHPYTAGECVQNGNIHISSTKMNKFEKVSQISNDNESLEDKVTEGKQNSSLEHCNSVTPCKKLFSESKLNEYNFSNIVTNNDENDDVSNSFVILGGSYDEENFKNLQSPLPSNINSPYKGVSAKAHLTSTPVTKMSPDQKSVPFDLEEPVDNKVAEDRDESLKVSVTEAEQEEDEERKLQLLKLSIASALSQGKSGSQQDEQNSDTSSPIMDDLDIAREIYISKGTTIPPTSHTTPRKLNTIPEDDIPTDHNFSEAAEDSVVQSVPSSPVKKALKYEEPLDDSFFSGSIQDTFEWDDYIGEQLVGKVNELEYENSPRQTMDFSDWTLDMDGSSSESRNHSKTGSEASESRPLSRASNLSVSESENSDCDEQILDLSSSTLQNTVEENTTLIADDTCTSPNTGSNNEDCGLNPETSEAAQRDKISKLFVGKDSKANSEVIPETDL